MYVAVEGCCHGELNKIYETLQFIESKENVKIGLLLCCGDFQSVRNEADLRCMACPDKYKFMQDFWEYYAGKRTAPYMTIFIGGNHEASNYLQELPYGGWVAPNIFYMGYASVVNYRGLRIGGLSGIFKQADYAKGHYEKPPYSPKTSRSVYHIRQLEVFKLKQLKQPMDIMMSHDWPNGVVDYGDKERLLRRKRHFADDIENEQLGSLPAWGVLTAVRPRYWFSGHLHVKFAAQIKHEIKENVLESLENQNTLTRFLALDKCVAQRDFIQVVDIDCPEDASDELFYDAEWLAVLKNTNELMSVSEKSGLVPTKGLTEKWDYSVDQKKIDEVMQCFDEDLKVPLNFSKEDSCVYNPDQHNRRPVVKCKTNAQTTEFCAKLTINDPLMVLLDSKDGGNSSFNNSSWIGDNSSWISDSYDDLPSALVSDLSVNPDEIDLDDSDEGPDGTSEASKQVTEDDTNEDQNLSCETKSKENGKRQLSLAANFSMNLPAPVSSTPVPPEKSSKVDQTEPVPSFPDVSDADSMAAESANSTETEDDSKQPPAAKKFKRRNASLYASTSEDSEEVS